MMIGFILAYLVVSLPAAFVMYGACKVSAQADSRCGQFSLLNR
jgi:hypothetical protein